MHYFKMGTRIEREFAIGSKTLRPTACSMAEPLETDEIKSSFRSEGDDMAKLFDPIRLGVIEAPNRIIMAPLTRGRASRDHVPTKIMADYYSRNARQPDLIISEAAGISREGLGFPYGPGLWTSAQVDGWKAVTEAVHRAGDS